MNKDGLYTLIALIVIFALGSAIALSESSPEHWYGFISAFATVVLAVTAIAGLNTWRKQAHYQSTLATAKDAIPRAYRCKLLLEAVQPDFASLSQPDEDLIDRLFNNTQLCDAACNELLSSLSVMDEDHLAEAEKLVRNFSSFQENLRGIVDIDLRQARGQLERHSLFADAMLAIKEAQIDEANTHLQFAITRTRIIYEGLKKITLKR
ncbi:hypothetical protein [Idiomarina aquatica]|uniref:Uncharacterized protein n=1 Tax=Idiomarina aquatica TaxID=1327752 RepID=A0AA94EH80_9GAMM|nr:hypothetical protein [Idiomarina aquatica]RUO44984.1 hypothetical protein CWE23_02850 [Idiomarina aquatica]